MEVQHIERQVSDIPTNLSDISSAIFTSQLPTSLVTSSPTKLDSHRTTIIAAATSALFVLIILTLAGIFAYRKHTLRKTKADLQIRREGHGLLDGEEFDDDVIPPQMRQVNAQRHSFARSNSPTPSLLKSRITDTGSIFREEVWPPPGFVDPISKNNSQVDLSKIVDDVMGASSSRHPDRYPSDSTDLSDLSTSRTIASTTPLSHWRRSTSSLGNDDPFGVSSSQSSFYPPSSYRLPPGASPPTHPGLITSSASLSYPDISSESPSFQVSMSDSTVGPSMSASSSASIHGSTLPALVPPLRPLSGTVPKKSSPLARALTQDQNLFSGVLPKPRESFDR
ncbi:hypothetical protein HYPSUDRAFT_198919 [Hypholoma sublateritium FD-334 SS-4]|uniref:Uncharacterized protein n=1 Tax=Hypholoma sublateritium (strain FD-334 SS-4) TaxID=945553 RepID=A0A0D2Q545_HYPSF|nr:hypothetical protein HYPSUDRAFT_198919 [Hypholoma sublateritium FD-334 SS-4]